MKLREIYELLEKEVNGKEILDFGVEFQQYPLKLSYSSYAKGINFLADSYQKLGMQAEVLHFPADGETVYADRHFPYAWDVDDAYAYVGDFKIADYKEHTYGVIPFSKDSGGECTKRLVPLEDLPKEGSLEEYAALITHYPEGSEVRYLISRNCPAFFSTVNLVPIHPSLDNSRRWYNDLFGAGQIDYRDQNCVGFSITPHDARELMAKYEKEGLLEVRYLMKTRTYVGEAPAVTSVIQGEDNRCFFITGHAYEPHATNNIAGVAQSMGAARVLAKLIAEGKLPKPKHSIRFFHGLEMFSLYAFGMEHPEIMGNAIGGISVDSFGRYGAADKVEHFVLRRSINVHPSNQHAICREVLDLACRKRGIDFEVRENSSNNEEMMQDRQFGPAWNLLYGSLWEEPIESKPICYFYHTDVDTADLLSPEMLSGASVVSAALAYYMASEGDTEEMAELAFVDWKRIVDDKCREALRLVDLDEKARTMRAQRLAAWRDLSIPSAEEAIGDAKKAAAFTVYIRQKVAAALNILCGGEPAKIAAPEDMKEVLHRLIPGPLGLGTISEPLREIATQSQGYYIHEYWCLDPSGTNFFLYDGKNSTFEVARAAWATRIYGVHETEADWQKELNRYRKLSEVLVKGGLAEIVPPVVVTKQDIKDGLARMGITKGDKIMVHSSLKSFGIVEGGADAVIDALLETVGEEGLVAMPAFSDCVEGGGQPAYDPDTSFVEPWVGLIPETFRKREGVKRSLHPSHSVCAYGTRAAEFVAQENPYDCFAKDGIFGKLLAEGGKIVFLGKAYGGNTFLHACEAWYNPKYYLEEIMARVATADGEKLVRVTNYPSGCRGGWYKLFREAEYFKKLIAQGVYRETPVGKSSIMTCDMKELAEAMKQMFAEDPYILLHKSGCRDCARLKGKAE